MYRVREDDRDSLVEVELDGRVYEPAPPPPTYTEVMAPVFTIDATQAVGTHNGVQHAPLPNENLTPPPSYNSNMEIGVR